MNTACMKDVCFELLGESASNKINCVSSSNNTITWRTNELPEDMEAQQLQQIKASSNYSLQNDEPTDITNMVILLVYVKYKHAYDVRGEMLYSTNCGSATRPT
jgi:hypothetical protein